MAGMPEPAAPPPMAFQPSATGQDTDGAPSPTSIDAVPVPAVPPPGRRRRVWIPIVALVVAVVAVVGVLALGGVFNSRSSSSGLFATPASFAQAFPAAFSEGRNASGGPWSIVAAEGLGLPFGISAANSATIGGTNCTFTPVADSPSQVTFYGTPSNAPAGEVGTWIFYTDNASLDGILLIQVSDGSAVPLALATGSTCISTFTKLETVDATSVVDSTTIASELNQGGGSAFLQNNSGATQVFVLLGASSATLGLAAWYASYTTCPLTATSGTGIAITAGFWATSGNLLSGPTTASSTC